MYRLMQPMYDEISNSEINNNINTIRHDNFQNLLDLCFHYASYFSLTIAPWYTSTKTDLMTELEPYLMKKIRVQKWFGYDLSLSDRSLDVIIYRATSTTQDILQKYIFDIFLQEDNNGQIMQNTQSLEDLCFFTDTILLLGTVSHEYLCYVNPINETVGQKIITMGNWTYCNDVLNARINISEII